MESLVGMDAAFLALETPTTPMHVGVALVLDPPEGTRSLFSPSTRYAQIRRVIQQRLHLIPPMRQRAVRVPLGLHHPVWIDDPDFELDDHLSRASLPSPGGQAELDAFVAGVMSRQLDPDRPLWEMHVLEGLAGRPHGTRGQGAPRHPRRGERRFGAGGVPRPDAAHPHRRAAAGVEPAALALQHPDAAACGLVAGPAAGIGAHHPAGRRGSSRRPRHAQPRAGGAGGAVAARLLRRAAHLVQRHRVQPQALCRTLRPAGGREAGRTSLRGDRQRRDHGLCLGWPVPPAGRPWRAGGRLARRHGAGLDAGRG